MTKKKRSSVKTLGIIRGPIRLKPTQAHKSKKAYNRKKIKKELKSEIKTAALRGSFNL